MKFTPQDPPRVFEVGRGARIAISDCGRMELKPDEQITLVTESGAEYDIARKSWGFYATPSMNGRLSSFGFRAVLVKSPMVKYYIFLVENGHEHEFEAYLALENHVVVAWLDSDESLARLETRLNANHHE